MLYTMYIIKDSVYYLYHNIKHIFAHNEKLAAHYLTVRATLYKLIIFME